MHLKHCKKTERVMLARSSFYQCYLSHAGHLLRTEAIPGVCTPTSPAIIITAVINDRNGQNDCFKTSENLHMCGTIQIPNLLELLLNPEFREGASVGQ